MGCAGPTLGPQSKFLKIGGHQGAGGYVGTMEKKIGEDLSLSGPNRSQNPKP